VDLLVAARDDLLDFAVYGHLTHDRVVLLEFKPVRSIFPILLSDVPTSAGHARGFMLGTLKDDLEAVAFALLGHDRLASQGLLTVIRA